MSVQRLSFIVVVLSFLVLPSHGTGAVLCVKRKGGVVLRDGAACRARETALDVAALGLRGEKGDKGEKGDTGAPGAAGPFPTGNLPSGATLRGVFQVAGTDTPAVAGHAASAISFVFPLAEAPEPHFVLEGGPPVEACPGSVSAPEATPGHVCVYTGHQQNASNLTILDPVTGSGLGSSRFGVSISAVGSADSNYFLSGTWAVTAP
jgi:hypothetical protein